MRLFSSLVVVFFCFAGQAQINFIFTLPGDKTFGEEDLIRAREDWFRNRRGLDEVERPGFLRKLAMLETKRAIEAQTNRGGPSWLPVGPTPMTMLNWAMGNVAGRASAIAYDPSNTSTVYLGTASGGLWKTVNGGQDWAPIFDTVGTLTIGSIFVEPNAPQNIWVGTGEQSNSCGGYFGLGLFYSPDGGATFIEKNGTEANPLLASYVTAVAVHPGNPDIVLAGGLYWCDNGGSLQVAGLYRSTDRGENWTQLLTGSVNDIVIDPTNPDVMYASVGRGGATGNGIYKSTNAGASWTRLENGVPFGNSVGRTRIAIAYSNTQVLYALMRVGGTRLYKTVDGGANWTLQNGSACEGQCSYNLCLDIDPTNPDTVLVGTIRPALSTNSGVTLTPLTTTWGSAQKVHQDIQTVLFEKGSPTRTPDGNTFWVGSDGGLWRSDDQGSNFVNLNNDLNITQFYDIAVHPSDPGKVFGGAQDNSSSRGSNDPLWDVTFVTGDGFMNLVDPTDPEIVFQTSYASGGFPYIIRSTSGGDPGTFSPITTSGMVSGDSWPWVVQIGIGDVDETTDTHIFVASGRVYRSSVNPIAWQDISGVLGTSTPASIVTPVPAAGKMTLYIGKENGTIFRSDDALAAAGSVVWNNVTGNFPGGWVSGIAADPTDPLRVFATRSVFGGAKLYRSDSGGGTWDAVGAGLPNVPANDVAVDPIMVNRVYVAMDTGVFVSEDNGENFAPMMNGLPLGVVVNDLEIDDDPYMLSVGTYGRGTWQIDLLSAPLTADVGASQLVCLGDGAALAAQALGGAAPYEFSWSVASGPDLSPTQFDDPTSDSPLFTPTALGDYVLNCLVTDSLTNEVSANVSVHAADQADVYASLLTTWGMGPGSPGWLAELDRNVNAVIDLSDLIAEQNTPICP